MKKTKFLFVIFFNILHSVAIAQALPKNSLEYKQLEALGYDIKNSENLSIASSDSNKIAIRKTSERTTVTAYYNRKSGLNSQQEFELLKIINKMNQDHFYQCKIIESSLACVLYIYGPHDPKTFARIMRHMENLDTVLEGYPEIYKLIN